MRAPGHLRCGASDQLAMPDSRVRERVFGEGGPCGAHEAPICNLGDLHPPN